MIENSTRMSDVEREVNTILMDRHKKMAEISVESAKQLTQAKEQRAGGRQ